MRHWLLGSWIAAELGKRFVLVNLVRNQAEEQIEADFGQHIQQTDDRVFVRWTWESIAQFAGTHADERSTQITEYFRQKTSGFKVNVAEGLARPRKAFEF